MVSAHLTFSYFLQRCENAHQKWTKNVKNNPAREGHHELHSSMMSHIMWSLTLSCDGFVSGLCSQMECSSVVGLNKSMSYCRRCCSNSDKLVWSIFEISSRCRWNRSPTSCRWRFCNSIITRSVSRAYNGDGKKTNELCRQEMIMHPGQKENFS